MTERAATLHSFELDDAVVVREAGTGRLWMLEGAHAQAWQEARRHLPDAPPPEEATTSLEPAPLPPGDPETDIVAVLDGAAVRVRCWDALLGRTLQGALEPLRGTAAIRATLDLYATKDGPVVALDGMVLHRPETLALGRWFLLRRLPAELYPWRRMMSVLHASSVGLQRGAVVLAAGSGSGKTTLAAALVAAGGRLVADDISPIEAGTRRVWPLPCAMSIKEGSWPVLAQLFDRFERCPPVRLTDIRVRYFLPGSLAPPGQGWPVAAIVIPRYAAGAPTVMTRVTAPELLRGLTESGTWPPTDHAGLSDMLAWVREVPAFRLAYSDVTDAVARIQALDR
ncbi:hypothetical protein [Marinivivus vitaminiproducens]|uniref:hypothetical protein n=1 Tax=Marinivivus vitaminiproducens TaxID=3035935 RepID=UPI0027A14402|nr:hypothetical protein P4R82_04080 [Geminicoccaceae bacterium SCSIO 64248]